MKFRNMISLAAIISILFSTTTHAQSTPQKIVAVGYNAIETSDDNGQTWSRISTPVNFTYLTDIVHAKNQYVAVGFINYPKSKTVILTSPDAGKWTIQKAGGLYALQGVTWGNNQYVAVGRGQQGLAIILTSPDGVNWTQQTKLPQYTNGLQSVTWGNNLFVAVSSNGGIITSPDAIQWSQQQSDPDSNMFTKVIWSHDQFVAVGGMGTLMNSSDGISWTIHKLNRSFGLTGVTYGNNQFLTVDSGNTYLSTDGSSWTNIQRDNVLDTVAWCNNQFLATSKDFGTFATSPDGIVWTSQDDDLAAIAAISCE